VAWPIAAHTAISKIWSSLRPDALAAAMSPSVTLLACLATFVDQCAQRLREPYVVERGATLGVRRPAVSFEYPRDQCFACLRDI
jgi:hypothetical protein